MGWLGDSWDGIKHGLGKIPGAIGSGVDNVFGSPGDDAERQRKALLGQQAEAAGNFANVGEGGFKGLGWESAMERDRLRRLANGEDSLANEQLRQGLQTNLATQQSLAASAPASSQPMAARTAAMNALRLGSGLAGQQATAGIQERAAYAKQLNDAIAQQRQMELQAALGSRQTATQGYGAGNAGTPEKSWLEKYGPAILGGIAASDERLKEDVEDGDGEADRAIKGLRAFTFKYKDAKYGGGKQFGVMAQGLERVGLKHAVIDTPAGKMVDGAKLATSNTAMIARLGRRLAALEGKAK